MVKLSGSIAWMPIEDIEARDILRMSLNEYIEAVSGGALEANCEVRPGLPTKARFHLIWDLIAFQVRRSIADLSWIDDPKLFADAISDELAFTLDAAEGQDTEISIHRVLEAITFLDPIAEVKDDAQTPAMHLKIAEMVFDTLEIITNQVMLLSMNLRHANF